MNEQNENAIVTQNGEVTELEKPEDFGHGMAFLNPEEMPDLEEAEVGINVQPEYFEFKQIGDSLRAVFNGITTIQTKDQMNPGEYKQIPAVVLQNRDGVKLNAGASLVSQFERLLPGTAVQISYKGTEKTKSGNNVKTYEVRLLNVKRVNVPVLPRKSEIQEPQKPKFTNNQRATEFWSLAYGKCKFTEQDGLDHLSACDNDFAKAIEALESPQF